MNTVEPLNLNLQFNKALQIYASSVKEYDGSFIFIANEGIEKSLYLTAGKTAKSFYKKFEGEEKKTAGTDGVSVIKKCPMNSNNRKLLQEIFPFTRPSVIGLQNSFGFGDRIGLANAGHIRSVKSAGFKPVLAQQSIRELTRTQRRADEVMDAAVWAVFQEGYENGFGADGDHLKTKEEIDMMLKAGFKMLTFDPSAYVDNRADVYTVEELDALIRDFPWNDLNDNFTNAVKRYAKENIIGNDLNIKADETSLMRAYCKYGKALIHIKNLNDFLKTNYSGSDYEIEVSVDETDSVTSVFEHYFIANELTRLGVKFISLAVRFVGEFEKGIDYKGDLELFREEYLKHLLVTKHFGTYKISLHSGSDKFSVYKVIGSIKNAFTHIKTAGTSYLESLKVTAIKDPGLFREILDFAVKHYDTDKKTYAVSADLAKIKEARFYGDDELTGLFNLNDARQVLHVTFGRVLSEKDSAGKFLFKERIIRCLKENEILYYEILIEHFRKHLQPFA